MKDAISDYGTGVKKTGDAVHFSGTSFLPLS
jgi:hypothetical protein